MTSSRKRTASWMIVRRRSQSRSGWPVFAVTKRPTSMLPSVHDSNGRSGCSPQLWTSKPFARECRLLGGGLGLGEWVAVGVDDVVEEADRVVDDRAQAIPVEIGLAGLRGDEAADVDAAERARLERQEWLLAAVVDEQAVREEVPGRWFGEVEDWRLALDHDVGDRRPPDLDTGFTSRLAADTDALVDSLDTRDAIAWHELAGGDVAALGRPHVVGGQREAEPSLPAHPDRPLHAWPHDPRRLPAHDRAHRHPCHDR